jgi:hypothetical protein
MEWGSVVPAVSGLLGVLVGSLITAIVQLRGIRATVGDNEAARKHEAEEAERQRQHELIARERERRAAAEAEEAERVEQARQEKRAEVLSAHESAIVALRRLLVHEQQVALRWQDPELRWGVTEWRLFERKGELETDAGLAVAKVGLLCGAESASAAAFTFTFLLEGREAEVRHDVEEAHRNATGQLHEYEQRAAAEVLAL